MIKYDLSWDDVTPPRSMGRSKFYKQKTDKCCLRLATKPVQVDEHWIAENGKNKSHLCAGAACPMCKAGNAPSKKYAAYVFDRDSDDEPELQVWRFGVKVLNQLAALAKDADYGDPTSYDIYVHKSGTGQSTNYNITPSAKKQKLDKFELEKIKNAVPLKELLHPNLEEPKTAAGATP